MSAHTIKNRDFNQLAPVWSGIFNLIAGAAALLSVFPFLFVMIISFTDETTLAENGYQVVPEKWSVEAYRYLFKAGDQLLRSYGITIFVTVVGTIISLVVTALFAYAVSRSSFKYRNHFAFFA